MSLTELPTGRQPPGAVLAVCTAVLAAGIVFSVVDWWPGAAHTADDLSNFLIQVALGLLLCATGIVWAVKTFNVVVRDRRWSWWIVPAPAIVVTALLIALLVPAPSFQSARSDFEAVVATMPNDDALWGVDVGPFSMSSITRSQDGTIYFTDDDQTFWSSTGGWVYSPAGQPTGNAYYQEFQAKHIDGPWYEFQGTHFPW